MQERIYEDLEPEARVAEMALTAVKRESITYKHKFTPEELAEKRVALTEVVTDIYDLEEEKKAYTDALGTRKKERELVRNQLVEKIRKGEEDRFDGCWKYHDYEERKVGYYDAQGILVLERDMTPNEFQREMRFEAPKEEAPAETAMPAIPESTTQQPEDVDFEEVNDDPEE